MNLLHIDSSIMGADSASRAISAAAVERLREAHPGIHVLYRDLVADPLPHLTLDTFLQLDMGADVQQFLNADIVVIGAGFYNFSVPSQLQAWIDRIAVRGRTFAYSLTGPIGLVEGKRVIVALARGNVYHDGAPFQSFEHAETLLRSAFTLIGVTDLEFIVAEGLGRGDEAREAAMAEAIGRARHLAPSARSNGL